MTHGEKRVAANAGKKASPDEHAGRVGLETRDAQVFLALVRLNEAVDALRVW